MGISSSLGSSALLPAGLGFRNVLINGDFRINQRGFTSSASSVYGFDRWASASADGTVTYSAQTFAIGNAIPGYEPTNYARIATSGQTLASAYSHLVQRIENVRTLAGQTASLSFWAKATSGTPKVTAEFAQVFGTGGSPSSTTFTYAGQVTLSTAWQRFTMQVNIPSISGKTIGTAGDDTLYLNLWTSAGSTYNSRSGSIGIQNSTIDFWGVQLEQNYQPTPFEQRPYGVELALCQRYFQQFTSTVGDNSFCTGVLYTTALFLGALSWSPMRAAPIVSFSGSFNLVAAGLANSCTPGSGNITATSCQISGTVTSYPAGNGGTMRMASGAYYSLNAEL